MDSTIIHLIDYNHEKKTLKISYHRKGTYQYKNVPYIEYQRLVVAKDKQQHIDRYIIGKYISIKDI
ncbi:KTSC domain-containing protein [Providencia rustigianii]|uniref:KTSC domain-containing protein n=1 Tax=Providencia rustigianii TaxID=158850 RepID=UPI00390631C6